MGAKTFTVNMLVAVSLSANPPLEAYATIVDVVPAVNGVEYATGPTPFVVYIIVAPLVAVASVIVTEPVKVPAAGDITGVNALIVNALVVVALSDIPPFIAYAIIVAVVLCVNGETNIVDDAFGVVPSVVYLIVAPVVLEDIEIVTEPV